MILKLILIQIGALFIIIFVLRQIFARHVNRALTNLQNLYQDNLKREEVLNEEIARTKTLREQEIAKAKEDARGIITEAKTKAREEADKLLLDAENKGKARAREILEKANLQLENEHRQMLQSMQDKIAHFSESAVGYILGQKAKRILQDELTEELLNELKDIPKEQVKLKEGLDEVKVTCAYPIEKPGKERIKGVVCQYLGKKDLNFNFKVDEAIIGGLIFNFGGQVIDGSLRSRLRQALSKIETKDDLKPSI